MKKIIATVIYFCTLLLATALIGPISHIINIGSLIVIIGVFISGIMLAGVKIDNFIKSIRNHQIDSEEIKLMSQCSKMAARASMIIIAAINLICILYNYDGINTLGEPLQGIATGILYSVVLDSFIQFLLFGILKKESNESATSKSKNVI